MEETIRSEEINILLVDDNPRNLIALAAIFDGLGYHLIKADSGEAALKCLLDEDFAIVLLDVQMPGMDGFKTATLIRERPRSRHTPIIFLTAINKTDECVMRGYSLGAIDYLFKPIMPEILRAKVAVFVDLVKKTRELELTRQRDQNEREMRAFEQFAQPSQIQVTAQAYGAAPLSKSAPQQFKELALRYSELLDLALEQRAYKVEHNISDSLRTIVEQLGFLRAGPRDVAELHTATLRGKLKDAHPHKAKVYVEEGHLMAFELMGYLVSYYRSFYISGGKKQTDIAKSNLPNLSEKKFYE